MRTGSDLHGCSGLEALDGRSGPAVELSAEDRRALARSIVQRVLAAQSPGEAASSRGSGRAPDKWPWLPVEMLRKRSWQTAAGVALAFGLVGTALASVAIYVAERALREPLPATDQVLPGSPSLPSVNVRTHTARRPEHASSVAVGSVTAGSADVPGDAEAPARSAAGVPAASASRPAAVPSAALPADVAPHRGSTRDTRAVPSKPAAERLLDQANALRAQRRWQQAERTYRRVSALAPDSDAAYVAWIAAAALRLEQLEQPAAALRLYLKALVARPNGSLAEEARYGIAEAHRALNEPERERQALRAFLSHHPHSMLRDLVQARLRALAGAAP